MWEAFLITRADAMTPEILLYSQYEAGPSPEQALRCWGGNREGKDGGSIPHSLVSPTPHPCPLQQVSSAHILFLGQNAHDDFCRKNPNDSRNVYISIVHLRKLTAYLFASPRRNAASLWPQSSWRDSVCSFDNTMWGSSAKSLESALDLIPNLPFTSFVT